MLDQALSVAVGVLGAWFLFARNTVSRQEVSDMILKETPLAVKDELKGIREELQGIRADVARFLGPPIWSRTSESAFQKFVEKGE